MRQRSDNYIGCLGPGRLGQRTVWTATTCLLSKEDARTVEGIFSVDGADSLPFSSGVPFHGTRCMSPQIPAPSIDVLPGEIRPDRFRIRPTTGPLIYPCASRGDRWSVYYLNGTVPSLRRSDGAGWSAGVPGTPTSITVDPSGALAIGTSRIVADVLLFAFEVSDSFGEAITTWGATGTASGYPCVPVAGDLLCSEEVIVIPRPESMRTELIELPNGNMFRVTFSFAEKEVC